MKMINSEIDKIMNERFGEDSLIALATAENDVPYVRNVNAYYFNGSFYVLTYALSNKMNQIKRNPRVAIAGEWFTGHGNAVNLGWFCKEENKAIAEKMRITFASWIDNGHNDFSDKNTIILQIALTDGVLFSNGVRYSFDTDTQ